MKTTNLRTRGGGRALANNGLKRLPVTEFLSLPATADHLKSGEISFTYARCPRCGEPHDLLFRAFLRPIETSVTKLFTHWALCPTTNEPIVITYLLNTVLTEDQ